MNNSRNFFKCVFLGVVFGVGLALFGVVFRFKKMIKLGVFVPIEHLPKDRVLLHHVKLLRPFYQTSKVSVSLGFTKFVHKIDEVLGNPRLLRTPANRFFVMECMALLSDTRGNPSPALEDLKQIMNQLLTDLVVCFARDPSPSFSAELPDSRE